VLRPSDIVNSRSILAAISNGYATALGVPPSTVSVRNVTDVATGAVTTLSSRRLGGTPGSAGVRVDVVVDLGKTPNEATATAIVAVLASPATAAQPLAAVIASVASSTTLPASSYSATFVASSVRIANSPFEAAPAPAASSGGGGGGGAGATGGIVGGIVGALALACAVWGFRSYAKHGQCPCCRNRKKELVYRRQEREEAEEVAKAIADAEAALENPVVVASSAAPGGAKVARPTKPKPKGAEAALVVRKLASEGAAAKAEVAELRRLLAAATAGTAAAAVVNNPLSEGASFAPQPVAK